MLKCETGKRTGLRRAGREREAVIVWKYCEVLLMRVNL